MSDVWDDFFRVVQLVSPRRTLDHQQMGLSQQTKIRNVSPEAYSEPVKYLRRSFE